MVATNTIAQQLLAAKQVYLPAIIQQAELQQQEQDNHNAQQVLTAHQECNTQQAQDTMCQSQEQHHKQNVEATQYTVQEQETQAQQQ